MTIVYREVKGSPLTYAQLDGNFAYLAADVFVVGFDLYYQTNKFGLASYLPPYP